MRICRPLFVALVWLPNAPAGGTTLEAAEAMADEVLARSTVPAPRGCVGHVGLALDHCVCPARPCGLTVGSNSRAFAQA